MNQKSDESKGLLLSLLRNEGALAPHGRAAMSFTIIANLTLLVTPLYMLQVYDRVLTSGSVETLILISAVALLLLIVFAVAELARRRAVALAAHALDNAYDQTVFEEGLSASGSETLRTRQRHFSTLQSFLSNGMILPLLDLPFTPLFLIVMFLIHHILGWLGALGAVILLVIAVYNEISTRRAIEEAQGSEQAAASFIAMLDRQRSAVLGMGMGGAAFNAWKERKISASAATLGSASDNGTYTAITRGLRMMLQVAALGVGAALVLAQQTTPGAIIAGSIILGRALAPIDQSVATWRQITNVRTAWQEFGETLFAAHASSSITEMPRPKPDLVIENLEITVPGGENPLVPKFSLQLSGGDVVALVGAIGSGKSTLLQTLAGVWAPLSGSVRLGGINMHTWASDDRGKYVGYLPQTGEILSGTVAENIARFSEAESDEVFMAAQKAGAHEMISALPAAYNTPVGPDGIHISAGQTALIALSRSMFREPVLALLDEPSANLDSTYRRNLAELIETLRSQKTITIMATHDPELIERSDRVVFVSGQRVASLTPEEYARALPAYPAKTSAVASVQSAS